MTIFYKLVGSLVAALVAMAASAEAIPAYSAYQMEGQQGGGLAAELVTYLNTKGKLNLSLQNMPRERMNVEVLSKPDFPGVVLLLNPLFVGDADKKKYLWTTAVVSDGNDVVSPIGKKVEYVDPNSLVGLKLAGIRGNKYAGLEDHFGKDIQRIDFTSDLQILKLVAAGRADVALMAHSVVSHLMKTYGESEGLNGKLYVSQNQHTKYDRYLFVSAANPGLQKDLNAITSGMASDPACKAILAKYGLHLN